MGVRDTPLSAPQDALLHSLERHVQLQTQSSTRASLLHAHRQQRALSTVQAFLTSRASFDRLSTQPHHPARGSGLNPIFYRLATRVHSVGAQWTALSTHARAAHALVQALETSHVHVAARTRALYARFEAILQQMDALDARVAAIAAPLPHFTGIETVAHVVGFGVQYAAPRSSVGGDRNAQENAVQVVQHRRGVDPTTPAFVQALEQMDAAVTYLTGHMEYKDSACYVDAYRTLAAGGIQCLRDYALSGLDAARDAVHEALQKQAEEMQHGSAAATLSIQQLDQSSAYYVNFQIVAPALAAVAKQLERLHARSTLDSVENLRKLLEVADVYATQRLQLLSPVLSAWLSAVSGTSDLVNVLRASCAQLLKVCEAECRLFQNLFGHDPSDELFAHSTANATVDNERKEDGNESFFERLIFQLSGLLYNTVRPQLLAQKDLEVLCEVIQVLKSEVIEAAITPRVAFVGYTEPVMHRMIQDAQERLILCMQKYIRDEIEGFVPTPADLDYPAKLVAAEQASAPLYATWYPSLEHTLLCLSKGYHFIKLEIFEELAQDAIQICAASLKMASADIAAAQGGLHGSLFLVKHLLTLREQITPFEIQFSQTSKALDFTTSADAMNELLVDASTLFRFSGPNGIVGLFSRGIPQIHETTADVKKDLEQELKKSCTAFIEIVLQQLADPLLAVMKQIAHAQQSQKATALDFRQYAFTAPVEVRNVLMSVDCQLRDTLPNILQIIRLYLRNSSTETILFKPVQRNLLDTVEHLKQLMEQAYTSEELEPCEEVFDAVLQQLRAL